MKMKRFLSALLAAAAILPSFAFGTVTAEAADGVKISKKNFPDGNFRAYVSENFDTDKNGRLSQKEINAATDIDILQKNVRSIKGVEYFTELEWLRCSNNELTELDLSNNGKLKYLACGCISTLASLNVTGNAELEYLWCGYGMLTELDVSKNKKLKELLCEGNKLKRLNLRKNKELELLYCSYNQLKKLNLSKNKKLKQLTCDGNMLTELDMSKNVRLESFAANDNQLTKLNVRNCPKLISLSCMHNQLTELDVSGNMQLRVLYCYDNRIIELDLSGHEHLGLENMAIDKNIRLIGFDGGEGGSGA